ncbi:MAG: CvpA family protein [Clostridiales bacterium]|nr:CvpA family protein [Clostridiales bacterium]
MFFVYDLIVIVVFVAVLAMGYKRGFSGSVVGIISVLASFIAAFVIANIAAPIVYESFFAENIKESVYSALPKSDSVNGFISELPGWLSFIIKDSSGQIAKFVESGTDKAALSIISIIQPMVTELIRAVVFMVSLVIMCLVARPVFKKVFKALFGISIIKGLDGFLGIILSVPAGLFAVCMFAAALCVAAKFTPEIADMLTDDIIEQSYIFKYAYNNAFTGFILGLI